MEISYNIIPTDFKGERCYVHARGFIAPTGDGIMTLQKLELSGCDLFDGIELMKTSDFGKTFTSPTPCEKLKKICLDDGTSYVMCDATPFYHKATGKILIFGHMARYDEDGNVLRLMKRCFPLYALYDEEKGEFNSFRIIEIPEREDGEYFRAGSGCVQAVENESGEILLPMYFMSYEAMADGEPCFSSAVVRCTFNGESIQAVEVGNHLTTDVPRGLYEPSVVKYKNEYFLTLRNDVTGHVTKSSDGLHFDKPIELCFDDGESLGNYNTQQHWLTGGGKLWLVYTRRAGNNDHVFRHRAPLFIAEFDPETMRVLRSTEKIAVPERGARLGNFGCQSFSEDKGYIFAAEWMQNHPYGLESCTSRGSDNSIFVSTVIY